MSNRGPGPLRPGFCSCGGSVLLALSFAASAQVTGTSDYLARMDSNRDGRVALVEYQDWLSYAFDRMDRNRDGTLASSELPGGRGKPLSRTQYRATLAATFNRQDANRDGSLSAKELAAPPQ
ncbi:MAG: hypothetical protein ABIO38_08240 [Luteimonas sp.]